MPAGAYADVPLFAFHLLEYSGVEFEPDVAEINARWEELAEPLRQAALTSGVTVGRHGAHAPSPAEVRGLDALR